MPADPSSNLFGLSLQVFLLDILLSGDNALIIALACRTLPDVLRRRAVLLGTALAIALRFALAILANLLLQTPGLKIIGGILLLLIAIKLLLQDEDDPATPVLSPVQKLGSAVMVIVSADLMLSLDNVVALAAVSQGQWLTLLLGLLLSVPLLMYGSLFVSRQLERYPILIPAGAMLLGWLSGQLIVSDVMLAGWIDQQAPALTVMVPLLLAGYVPMQARIIRQQRPQLQPPPPSVMFSAIGQWFSRFGQAGEDSTPFVPPTNIEHDTQQTVPLPAPEHMLAPPPTPVIAKQETQITALPLSETSPHELEAAASSGLPRYWQLIIGLTALIGLISVGWIILHLLSHGVLPAPEHPPQP